MLFEEEQRFNQRWLWLLLIALAVICFAVFGFGLVEQLVFKRPWGDRPVSDTALLVTSVLVCGFVAAMLYIFYTLRMQTRVDITGIHVRFAPFPGTVIEYREIASCEARTYKPLKEYGGWGIKYGNSGKAYNMSGDRGAQLVMKNGKRLLIGSQHADELAKTINLYLK